MGYPVVWLRDFSSPNHSAVSAKGLTMRFIASCVSALILLFCLLLSSTPGFAHDPFDENPPPFLVVDKLEREDPFRQLDDVLPSPNESRLASGAPGPAYWQQQVDMEIDVTLDAVNHRLDGLEKVTYHNILPTP